jgi:trans-2,3-dihydro-3-hydroxyanthranilate isomerase
MARSLPFFLVDVFADAPLTGTPLAVVGDADDVDEDLMRAITPESNQSDTTFVLASTRRGVAWRLRSFTPAGVEVGGAGHNALGAWWWLAAAGRLALSDGANRFSQEIDGRVLPVEVTADGGRPRAIAMDQEAPRWGDPVGEKTELAASLRLPAGELGEDVPAQVVSTGAPHLLFEARTGGPSIVRSRTDPGWGPCCARWAARVVTCTASTPSRPIPPPTHASSTRRSASPRTRRPAPRQARLLATSSSTA